LTLTVLPPAALHVLRAPALAHADDVHDLAARDALGALDHDRGAQRAGALARLVPPATDCTRTALANSRAPAPVPLAAIAGHLALDLLHLAPGSREGCA
jgi:hypothetical protein